MHGSSFLFRIKGGAQHTGTDKDGQRGQEYDLVRPHCCELSATAVTLRLQGRLMTLQLLSCGAQEHGSFAVKYTRMQVNTLDRGTY